MIEGVPLQREPECTTGFTDPTCFKVVLSKISVIVGPVAGKGFGQLGARGAGRAMFFEKPPSSR